MLVLLLGLALFVLTHSVRVFADPWRGRQIARLGAGGWKVAYSLLSVGGFALIVWGFSLAQPGSPVLWVPPEGLRHLAALLMVLSFVLLAAAYVPGNHIKARVGHPMVLAVKTWAVAHLLANGTLVHVVLFGTFLAWAVVVYIASRRRDRAAGTTYPVAGFGRDAIAVVVGVVAWGFFAHVAHYWLIGVRPMG